MLIAEKINDISPKSSKKVHKNVQKNVQKTPPCIHYSVLLKPLFIIGHIKWGWIIYYTVQFKF